MRKGTGSAASGPRRGFHITNPVLARLVSAWARRKIRRMPGLEDDKRQALLQAFGNPPLQ